MINRGGKKSPLKDTLPGNCTINWITQVYKEIHIFRPPSRQGAQVLGFQGKRQLSVLLFLHHSHNTESQGATKSLLPKSQQILEGWRPGNRISTEAAESRARWKRDEICRDRGRFSGRRGAWIKTSCPNLPGDHPFFSSSISLLSCCWLRLQTI